MNQAGWFFICIVQSQIMSLTNFFKYCYTHFLFLVEKVLILYFRVKEYNQAFGSRPKIPRTPDVSSLGKGSLPADSTSQGRNSQQSLGKLSQNSQGRSSLQSQGKTSQSKVPRTPDSGKRPTSRGSISGMPPPQPQYSESGPRPSSAGKSGL